MILDPDRPSPPASESPLQLRAAQELFETRRAQIPLVARRAEEAGITCIDKLQDIVPLLFAHRLQVVPAVVRREGAVGPHAPPWLQTLSVAT